MKGVAIFKSKRKTKNYIVSLYVFLALALYGAEGYTYFAQVAGIILFMQFVFSAILKGKIRVSDTMYVLPLFFMIMMLGGIPFPNSYSLLFTQFQIFLLVLAIFNAFSNGENLDYILWTFWFGCLAITIIQILGGRQVVLVNLQSFAERTGGTAGNVNDFALMLLMAINFILLTFLRQNTTKTFGITEVIKIALLIVFVHEVVFVTVSKSASLILFLSLVAFYYLKIQSYDIKSKVIFIPITIGAVMWIVLNINSLDLRLIDRLTLMVESFGHGQGSGDTSTVQRASLLQEGYRLFKERPLLGWGTGQFRWVNQVHYGFYSHNNFIEIAVNHGIIALVLFYSSHGMILTQLYQLKSRFRSNLELKWLMYMVCVLFLLDMAYVTYYNKVYYIVFMYVLARKKSLRRELMTEERII